MNPYNELTFNKIVNGKKLTMKFQMDDLKSSHKDPLALDNLLHELKSVFRKEDELSETQSTIYKYLRITINYFTPGKISITNFEYLEDIIVEDRKVLGALTALNSNYACGLKLFQVDNNSPLVNR